MPRNNGNTPKNPKKPQKPKGGGPTSDNKGK